MLIIITINYNLSKHTIECVNSLLRSDYNSFKIFLIDNHSNELDFAELKKAYEKEDKINILRMDRNLGYVGGVNYGLQEAGKLKPDFYLIMNNDTIIDQSAISELVNCAEKYERNAIVSGKVYYYDQPNVLQHTGVFFTDERYKVSYYPGKNEKDVGQFDIEAERDSLDDVFWLLPAKIVNDIGYYCDYFYMYAEQGDYAQRARRKGYNLIYTPKAKLWHKVSMTAGGGHTKALPIAYWRGKSSVIFSYRNLKRRYFIILLFVKLIRNIKKLLTTNSAEKKMAKAWLKGYSAGFMWLFKKVPDNGYNPYINKTKTEEISSTDDSNAYKNKRRKL